MAFDQNPLTMALGPMSWDPFGTRVRALDPLQSSGPASLLSCHAPSRIRARLCDGDEVLYSTARLGLAAHLSPDLEALLGRPPLTLVKFIGETVAALLPSESGPAEQFAAASTTPRP